MAEPAVDTKPKPERKEIQYTVIGAIGPKDAKLDELDWKILGNVTALTPGAAKGALLEKNPEFPGPVVGSEGPDSAATPKDLQSLVRGKRLWLEAKSNWKPQLVEVEQPPPKFVGL